MSTDGDNKIVSLSAFRKDDSAESSVEHAGSKRDKKALMVSVNLWQTSDPTSPIEMSVLATDADAEYNFAELFLVHPDTPRLLALANGLDGLALKLRAIHNGLNARK